MQNQENKRSFDENAPAGYIRSCTASSAEGKGGELNVGI